MRIGDILSALEAVAPLGLQEDWDNSGLQVGSRLPECTGVLLCVDVTPAIVDEAINRGCNLIVSHHPLFFHPVKRLTGETIQQTAAMNAIAAGVSIYSCHTCMDNAPHGVSYVMAERLQLDEHRPLVNVANRLLKLSVMVPESQAGEVRLALFEAGAGTLGNYDCCSYNINGTGTFKALEGANPFVGDINSLHYEQEVRIDVLVPTWLRRQVENALIEVHPYEEPAYEFTAILNPDKHSGSGAMGIYNEPITARQLVERVKKAFNSPVARCSAVPDDDVPITRVALCGGAGGSFIKNAIAAGAQAYITSDTRYNEFIDNVPSLFIIDIGHFESESCTKDIFYHIITEKFPNFAVYNSELEKNPISYL